MFAKLLASAAASALVFTSAGSARDGFDADAREAAINALAQIIEGEYFDAERAGDIADSLRETLADGGFDALDSPEALSGALSRRLYEEDRHFSVQYVGPEAVAAAMAGPATPAPSHGPSTSAPVDPWAGLRAQNFGFAEVSILPGNVGYIRLNQFAPIAPSMETAMSALEFVAGTNGVIFDLRTNGGGAPAMVQFLTSHFLEPGGGTLINTFVSRDYEYPQQMWSLPRHPAGHRPETPIVVLTSGRTGSAAEGFSYHMQAMERGLIVGETTVGAGNPGGQFLTEEGYSIFVSTGSARNPITGSNWEGTGVHPDVEVDAADALNRGLLEIYALIQQQDVSPDTARAIEWAMESLRAETENYALSQRELRRYAGDWGIRDTRVENGELIYQREGSSPSPLRPLGNHRFAFYDDDRYRVVFNMDGGQAQSMDLHVSDGRVIHNSRTD